MRLPLKLTEMFQASVKYYVTLCRERSNQDPRKFLHSSSSLAEFSIECCGRNIQYWHATIQGSHTSTPSFRFLVYFAWSTNRNFLTVVKQSLISLSPLRTVTEKNGGLVGCSWETNTDAFSWTTKKENV